MALALVTPSGETLAVDAEGGPQASARLVPEALALLDRAGLALADVDAIGFGRGPGAFTGLRTACAVAQGLAFGAGKPVLSLDSLMLVAEDARQQAEAAGEPLDGRIWVAMDARMGEIYAAAYRLEGGRWITESEPALYAPATLRAHWGTPRPSPVPRCGCSRASSVWRGTRRAAGRKPPRAAGRSRRWPSRRGRQVPCWIRPTRCRCTCATRSHRRRRSGSMRARR